jgi:hypothetical protein
VENLWGNRIINSLKNIHVEGKTFDLFFPSDLQLKFIELEWRKIENSLEMCWSDFQVRQFWFNLHRSFWSCRGWIQSNLGNIDFLFVRVIEDLKIECWLSEMKRGLGVRWLGRINSRGRRKMKWVVLGSVDFRSVLKIQSTVFLWLERLHRNLLHWNFYSMLVEPQHF